MSLRLEILLTVCRVSHVLDDLDILLDHFAGPHADSERLYD